MGSACSCGSKDPDPSSPTPEKARKTTPRVAENGAPPSSPPPVNGHVKKEEEQKQEQEQQQDDNEKGGNEDEGAGRDRKEECGEEGEADTTGCGEEVPVCGIPITVTPCSSLGPSSSSEGSPVKANYHDESPPDSPTEGSPAPPYNNCPPCPVVIVSDCPPNPTEEDFCPVVIVSDCPDNPPEEDCPDNPPEDCPSTSPKDCSVAQASDCPDDSPKKYSDPTNDCPGAPPKGCPDAPPKDCPDAQSFECPTAPTNDCSDAPRKGCPAASPKGCPAAPLVEVLPGPPPADVVVVSEASQQAGSEAGGVMLSEEEEELVSIMAGELAALVARLETAVDKLEKAGGGVGKPGPTSTLQEECTVPYVLAYDDLLSGPFKTFFECSHQIGGDVAAMSKLVQEAFINQRAFLVMASKSQRPLDTELPQVLEPTGKKIQEVIAFRESKRQSPFFNHLSAVSESIPGLSWVAVAPAPSPYIKEMGDSAVFYTNRVLKEYREKDKLHVEWVQHWNGVFRELHEYVKKYHTTGLSWNTRGGNAMGNLNAAPPNCGVPPPPPPAGIPPPPPPMMKLESSKAPLVDDGRNALFASINKGTDITSGLKKSLSLAERKSVAAAELRLPQHKTRVTDDMKTHKNPNLREGPRPFVKQSIPTSGHSSPARDPFSGTPRMVQEGKKWFVEYQKDKPNLVISGAKMDQSVYIYRCQNTVVQVKGKVNSVTLDSCKKSSVVFDNLVSSAEVVNCQSCQVQVMGVMPIISIEKTDGCQVYLSKDSLKTEIVTSKSTEMNILVPKPDGEFAELPIPEQFKTVINGLSLVTTCTEIS